MSDERKIIDLDRLSRFKDDMDQEIAGQTPAISGNKLTIGSSATPIAQDIVNVNDINGVPTTAYGSAAAARAAVDASSGLRIQGQIITYLLADGWYTDQYIGSATDSTSWGTASNWKTLGPVSVSQNTETGKTELLIGDTPVLIVDNEPTAGSDNLVKSGGVYERTITANQFDLSFNANGALQQLSYPIKSGRVIVDLSTEANFGLYDENQNQIAVISKASLPYTVDKDCYYCASFITGGGIATITVGDVYKTINDKAAENKNYTDKEIDVAINGTINATYYGECYLLDGVITRLINTQKCYSIPVKQGDVIYVQEDLESNITWGLFEGFPDIGDVASVYGSGINEIKIESNVNGYLLVAVYKTVTLTYQLDCVSKKIDINTKDIEALKVKDVQPTLFSENPVESQGIVDYTQEYAGNYIYYKDARLPYYNSTGTVLNNEFRAKTISIPVSVGDKYYYRIANSNNCLSVAALDSSKNVILDKSVIIGTQEIPTDGVYVVPSGVSYLIFTALNDIEHYAIKAGSISDNVYCKDIVSKDIPFINLFSRNNIIQGATIGHDTGVINYNAYHTYHLVKIHVTESGYYLIDVPKQPDNDTLWKYTDSTYATAEKKIYANSPNRLTDVAYLEAGYYALSWNNASDDVAYDEVIFAKGHTFKSFAESAVKNYNLNITDFSDFSGNGWTISADKKTANNTATGLSNMLTFAHKTYEDSLILTLNVKPTAGDGNGYYNICMGKYETPAGTMVSYGKDSGGTYIAICQTDTGGVIPKHKFYFTGLIADVNKEVSISLQKKITNTILYSISVVDVKGREYRVDNIGDGEPLTGDVLSNPNDMVNGNCWGAFAIYVETGTFNIKYPNMEYDKDMGNLQLLFCGHSSVEGTTMDKDMDKCLSIMLRDTIGEKNVLICGRGGASVAAGSFRSYMDYVFGIAKSAKYVLFWFGGNDPGDSSTISSAKIINDTAKLYGLVPVWLTQNPIKSDPTKYDNFNQALKDNFENVIDVCPCCFVDEANTVFDDSVYLFDGVHLNEIGYKRCLDLIKMQAPYILY